MYCKYDTYFYSTQTNLKFDLRGKGSYSVIDFPFLIFHLDKFLNYQ
jgi:hypothetical protein